MSLDQLVSDLADMIAPDRSTTSSIELNSVAKSWGAVDILYRSQQMHGYTEWTARGPVIQLSVAKTEGRRRFALAHESAHLVLDPLLRPNTLDVWGQLSGAARIEFVKSRLGVRAMELVKVISQRLPVEDFCNKIAVELLVPSAALLETGDVTGHGFAAIENGCRTFKVSLSLMVNRLNDVGYGHTLLRMAPSRNGSWIVTSTAGLASRHRVRMILSNSTGATLFEMPISRRDECIPARIAVELELRNASYTMPMEVVRRKDTVFALVEKRALRSALRTSSGRAEQSISEHPHSREARDSSPDPKQRPSECVGAR